MGLTREQGCHRGTTLSANKLMNKYTFAMKISKIYRRNGRRNPDIGFVRSALRAKNCARKRFRLTAFAAANLSRHLECII